ncbi:MAG: aminoacyl-histidine dipeptidase [Lachnospiraceae bacterium]|nr:aminoacyl-histidine dipeptidase [Lachnospiraceae bacterium]
MSILGHLEPANVFRFFEEICNIPHGSGNMTQISNYLVNFAKERNLEYYQDSIKNVIIIKEATNGYEKKEPIMLQGHMDMVAVKKPESSIDMATEGLRLVVDEDIIYAKDTSLGGDDGIAVAYELALLDATDIKHPRIECVFTVDEEVGLNGAAAIDLSVCKAKRMLNLDSEEEGIFLTGCAGGMRVDCQLPLKREMKDGALCEIHIGGLCGGHSGAEIHKGRANSNTLMGRFLVHAGKKVAMNIVDMEGGLADNAIPRETKMQVVVSDVEALNAEVQAFDKILKTEYATKDPNIFAKISVKEVGSYEAVCDVDSKKTGELIFLLPGGVQAMSGDVEGLVETSLNMGQLSMKKEQINLGFSVRSSIESAKYMLVEKLYALTESYGGSCKSTGDYPGWAYRVDSPLRDGMVKIYTEMFGCEPKIEAIHAGLECGFFLGKIPELDCVSIGPEMKDIHTTEETMSISSVKRTWEFILKILEQL